MKWNTTVTVTSAPKCVAARCQACMPSGNARGNCCGSMQCLFDPVFSRNICVPPMPWICDADPSTVAASHHDASSESLSESVEIAGAFTTAVVQRVRLTDVSPPQGAPQYWTTWGRGNVNSNGDAPAPAAVISSGPWANPLVRCVLLCE